VLAVFLASANAATLTIRPNGVGAYSEWGKTGCILGWQCVDETPADTSDYVSKGSGLGRELFNFQDTGLANGTSINSVTLYYYGKYYKPAYFRVLPMLVMGLSNYTGTPISLTSTWAYYNRVFYSNPITGMNWTVAEVNALNAGMATVLASDGGFIAQVYAVVNYN